MPLPCSPYQLLPPTAYFPKPIHSHTHSLSVSLCSRKSLLTSVSAWTPPLGGPLHHLQSGARAAADPTPSLATEACAGGPTWAQSWTPATGCNTHTQFSGPLRGGWTPASQTHLATQPEVQGHPVWPGKYLYNFCLDGLPFLVMSVCQGSP